MKKLLTLALTLVFMGIMVSSVEATSLNLNRPLALPAGFANSELTLQQVFDASISNGTLNAYSDQSSVALWTPDEAAVDQYLITMIKGDSGNLGIYSALTGNEYDLQFLSGQATLGINDAGALYINGILADNNFGPSFGFYWKNTSYGLMSYTEDSKNTGLGYGPDNNILALAYLVPNGYRLLTEWMGATTVTARDNNDWILAFEDRPIGNNWGDGDFNDAVFFVEDMKPAPVPEPATMLLLGTGLVGLAGIGRRKFLKK